MKNKFLTITIVIAIVVGAFFMLIAIGEPSSEVIRASGKKASSRGCAYIGSTRVEGLSGITVEYERCEVKLCTVDRYGREVACFTALSPGIESFVSVYLEDGLVRLNFSDEIGETFMLLDVGDIPNIYDFLLPLPLREA